MCCAEVVGFKQHIVAAQLPATLTLRCINYPTGRRGIYPFSFLPNEMAKDLRYYLENLIYICNKVLG